LNGLGLTSPAPSAPPQAATAPPAVPTRKQTDQAQKHAKFAVSALDYDDYATARLELRKALALLGE
jgi:vacuolar protein sorting-associated protein VTA1